MRVFSVAVTALALALLPPKWAAARQHALLQPFRSDREIARYLRRLADERNRLREAPKAACSAKSSARGRTLPRTETVEPSGRRGAVVFGTVRLGTGEPFEGAEVRVEGLGLQARTSADGSFRIRVPADSLLRERTVRMRVRGIGMEPMERAITLASGRAVEVTLQLCQATFRLQEMVVSAAAAAPSITNVQHAGVDEGGIVKLHGDHLVVLRRGRLFTVSIADGRLRGGTSVDAFAPDIDADGDWYDELILYGDKAVVVGYSYTRGGTEIVVFRIEPDGSLHYRSTYHLRSNDYYSSRNYASRLIGSRLVFYAPLYLPPRITDPLAALPAMRKWHRDAGEGEFRRIGTWQRVYRPSAALSPLEGIALHTVTTCDLATAELECDATVVIGPEGRVFYTSPRAVYVWSTPWRRPSGGSARPSLLYRLPLDGSRPRALEVTGSPTDQFSFLEGNDGHLNVLVRVDGRGDAMWSAERAAGPAELVRFPVAAFEQLTEVPRRHYRPLPAVGAGAFHNRFVGEHLLYGAGNGWGRSATQASDLYVLPIRGGDVDLFRLSHGVDRIEPMGRDAVVIGTDGKDLHFRAVRLGERAELGHRFVQPDASQGELRSHGFFYRADGPDTGVIGLPVRGPGRPGYEHLFDESAGVLFLRNGEGRFDTLGELAASSDGHADDNCRASCVDWYGNTRPLFITGRAFALLGYEIVEGAIGKGRIREVARLSFAPKAAGVR